MTTIFPELSLDRKTIRWENHLDAATPWTFEQGIWFKREDFFAPLGYGGPNGSKLRQLIYYIKRFRGGKTHIVTGASVQSPQLSMSAIVGAHYGLPTTQVVYSKPETLMRHVNPHIAIGFGANTAYAKGPYNPIIQKMVEDISMPQSLVVEYGITMPMEKYPAEELYGFHEVGANQVDNLPPYIQRLIVPAGSCNTLTSILLGLSIDPHNVQELYTIGIGPDKREWALERLRYMGVDPARFEFRWKHYSLHETGYSTYDQKFKGERFRGIEFHPTYEAKMWRYLRKHDPIEQDGKTGFWIVGSEPKLSVIEPFYTRKEA